MGWESKHFKKLFQDDQEVRLVQNIIDSHDHVTNIKRDFVSQQIGSQTTPKSVWLVDQQIRSLKDISAWLKASEIDWNLNMLKVNEIL